MPLSQLTSAHLSSASSAQPAQLSHLSSASSAQNWTPKWYRINPKSYQRSFFEGFCRCLLRCSQNLDLEAQPAQLSYVISATSAQPGHLSQLSSAQPAHLSHLRPAISAQPAQLSHLSSAISTQPAQPGPNGQGKPKCCICCTSLYFLWFHRY